MGLFSTKKVIQVDSVVYNLAGPLEDRPDYLKTCMARTVLSGNPKAYVGEAIVKGQLDGPTLNQKRFFRWAASQYPGGQLSGQITNKMNVNTGIVAPFIPVPSQHTLEMYSAFVDTAEIGHWAERHVLTSRRDQIEAAWVANYTPETGSMQIQYADASFEDVPVPDFDPDGTYVIAHYALIKNDYSTAWTTTQTVTNATTKPGTTGYLLASQVNETVPVTLTTTVRTIVDDGTPPVTDTTTTSSSVTNHALADEVFRLEEELAFDPGDGRYRFRETELTINHHYVVEEEVTDVTTTDGGTSTRTITTTEVIRDRWSFTRRERTIYRWEIVPGQSMFFYRIGSGNPTLDALNVVRRDDPEFFPVIPLRLDNVPIDDPSFEARFDLWKKAYRRATSTAIGRILASIEDNENVDDIDFAFLVHGVEINTDDRAGMRYVYEFLRSLIADQAATVADIPVWQTAVDEYNVDRQLYINWEQSREGSGGGITSVSRPPYPVLVKPNLSGFEQKVASGVIPYRTLLSWATIGETLHTGLGRTGARKGDLWWQKLGDISIPLPPTELTSGLYAADDRTFYLEHVRLWWQDSASTHRVLDIYGLKHLNLVYGGRAVSVTLKEAIDSAEETGFIVPLHLPTLDRLPLKDANQLALVNRCLVFNCYKIVKIRWYQRGIFRIAFMIALAIVAAIVFPGGVGLLGSHMAVGANLGLTGISALVAGAALNAMAAILLSTVIQIGAGELLGDELGALLSTVLMVVASGFIMNGSIALNWGAMLDPANILKMLDAVTGSIASWAQARAQGMAGEMQAARDAYLEESEKIQDKMLELLGSGGADLDPLMFLGRADSSALGMTTPGLTESPSTFLGRTLLTGSDISEMSRAMIDDFADLTLSLPDPIT